MFDRLAAWLIKLVLFSSCAIAGGFMLALLLAFVVVSLQNLGVLAY